jgi:hypothetical protein
MCCKPCVVLGISPWYYAGPIIAAACIVLLVAAAYWVRRVSISNAWRPVDDGYDHCEEKEGKVSFFVTVILIYI